MPDHYRQIQHRYDPELTFHYFTPKPMTFSYTRGPITRTNSLCGIKLESNNPMNPLLYSSGE
jgi:hypothetical protein